MGGYGVRGVVVPPAIAQAVTEAAGGGRVSLVNGAVRLTRRRVVRVTPPALACRLSLDLCGRGGAPDPGRTSHCCPPLQPGLGAHRPLVLQLQAALIPRPALLVTQNRVRICQGRQAQACLRASEIPDKE